MERPNRIKFSKEEIIERLRTLFSRRDEVILAYLFGSYAEGKVHKFSDVDVAVYVKDVSKDKEFEYELNLIGELNDELHSDDVDLVIMNSSPPTLVHWILHHGIVVKCTDEGFRCMYIVRNFRENDDAKHLLKIQKYYLDQRLEAL